jgi:diguanylate cyclase (GGDEF)-like protein/PAS domain S-box-containing protein
MGNFPLEGWKESADAGPVTVSPTPSVPARAPDRVLAAAYVCACAVLLVASVLTDARIGAALRALVGVMAVAAMLRTAHRSTRIGTNPWLCLAAGLSCAVSAATVGAVARAAGATPPLWSSWMAFAGYLMIGVGFLILAQVTMDTASRTAFLDGAVIGTAMVMVLWVSLIAPLHTESMDIAQRLTLAMAPVRDGVLVAILAWITLAPGRHTPALRMLGYAVAILLLADLAASTALNLDTDITRLLQPLYAGAWALLGLGAICATRELRIDTAVDAQPDHPARSVLIGVALLMGPVTAVVGDLSTVDGMVMIGACSTVLALGVMARFVNLVHQNQRAHAATAISERRFRMLADSAPVGIFELGRGTRVTYANEEGSRLLGRSVVGGSVDEMLANVDCASHPAFRDALDAVARGEPAAAELRLADPGLDRWVTWQGVPVPTPGPHLPMAFASTLDITDLKRAQAALARQATHDPLTGLPNRRLLIEALITALADLGRGHRTGTVALMFVDLDRFKLVNDVLGHDAGDALLRTAAARLRNAVRAHDMVARFGGDEFVVLLQHVADRGELHDVAQRILDAIATPIQVGGETADVGASVGIATASGPDDDPDALVRNADAAMYRAKEHGRGRYEFFRPDGARADHRMR